MYDHRAIAKAMNLFHFEEHSPGMVFWHPMGLRVFRAIEEFMRGVYQSHGFEEVRSPIALSRSLWEKSGHWDKFANNYYYGWCSCISPDRVIDKLINQTKRLLGKELPITQKSVFHHKNERAVAGTLATQSY